MFERFTQDARRIVLGAIEEAQQLRHPKVGTEHLLLSMLGDEDSGPYAVLHEAGLDHDVVRAEVTKIVGESGRILTDDDAEALKAIGIDLDAVLANVER